MNVIKLMGGLGNQLYQYAFGQVQKASGIEVMYDRSWFDFRHPGSKREYNLDKFTIEVPLGSFLNQQEIREKGYEPALLRVSNCNFFGYWQFLNYYLPILPQLKSILKVKQELYTPEYEKWKELVENSKITAIHIRRGDYLTTKGFEVLPLSYYYQALTQTESEAIFIFSDDLKWCKKVFPQSAFKRELFFIDLPDYLAWDLMRVCVNQIIANSSFSQWAGFMNPNKDKKIFYSSLVTMEDEKERHKQFPKEWIRI